MSAAPDDLTWDVAALAETVTGQVVLRMTEGQAEELLSRLRWLLEGDA